MSAIVRSARLVAVPLLALLLESAGGTMPPSSGGGKTPGGGIIESGKSRAPEFPAGLDWLNTDRPLSLREERGKIVILDFWTFCCINCIHVIPDLKRLEKKYARELVVIGVHSAKFTTEQGTENIREAILRYDIEHPVVNDRDFAVWNSYGVNAWPTFILIDPDGNVVARHSGEGVYDAFDGAIRKLVDDFGPRGKIDRTERTYSLEKSRAPESLFSFPGKIAADRSGTRLFITDSNHHRVVVLSLPDFTVSAVIGDGTAGFRDGSFVDAEFNRPQGICFSGDALYVADTENHAIRKIDLVSRRVVTLVGTGRQSRGNPTPGRGTSVALDSPWDLVERGGILYIAMAGSHQIWTLDLRTDIVSLLAGSGEEGLVDGDPASAAFAQPSGITTDGKKLYVADSEVSAVRSLDFASGGEVRTIVGKGLFDFGDTDGAAPRVRLQHPIGIAWHENTLYVADTYNNKIKRINPSTGFATTIIGDGKAGFQDGVPASARLNEPNGLVVVGKRMYITDTDNNVIRYFDFDRGVVGTVVLHSPEALAPQRSRPGPFAGMVIRVPVQDVGQGQGVLRIAPALPAGYKWNMIAPFYVGVFPADTSVARPRDTEKNIENPVFPLDIPVTFRPGATTLLVDLIVYYCEAKTESVCLVKQVRFEVPLKVGGESREKTVVLPYSLAKEAEINGGAVRRNGRSPAMR